MDELKPPKKAEQGFTMDDVVDDLAAVMDENANVEVQRVDNETAFIKVPRTLILPLGYLIIPLPVNLLFLNSPICVFLLLSVMPE